MEAIDLVNHALHELKLSTGIASKIIPLPPHQQKQNEVLIEFIFGGHFVNVRCICIKQLLEHHVCALESRLTEEIPIMVVTIGLPEKTKINLRQSRIGYLDGSGNLFFVHNKNFIWIEGRKPGPAFKRKQYNAFTKSGIKLISYLLMNEELIAKPYREISRLTRINLGSVNYNLNQLVRLDCVTQKVRKNRRISDRKKLIELWAPHYNETLKPSLLKGTFRLIHEGKNGGLQQTRFRKKTTCWGGQSAANALTPNFQAETATVYTAESVNDLRKHYSFVPDPNGNIKVYEMYWSDEYQQEPHIAPPLIVYADLLGTGDSRCINMAKKVMIEYLSK